MSLRATDRACTNRYRPKGAKKALVESLLPLPGTIREGKGSRIHHKPLTRCQMQSPKRTNPADEDE